MSRRSPSPLAAEERTTKRQKLDTLTPESYRNGIMLAPMVRSGSLPTRLFALKHGAKLVWGPEIVDRAILHAKRVQDPVTGTIQYMGQQSKAMFTCHPLEKPYFIYQIGSANPDLAVQAARIVMEDIAGVELNCGCPKPFSTSGGMGAALLSTPDLLCSILEALRRELPAHISVSAKIRLLPTQEDTKKLVERIINTGVNCLTIHCRTRNMRKTEPAHIDRLKEIVDFIRGLGKDVAIIQNGDCVGYEDARRIRAITGADSVMIATAAESNPSVFSPKPLADLEDTLIPSYLRLARYLDNHWASTKFCVSGFRGPRDKSTKAVNKAVRERIVQAKSYDDVTSLVGAWTGEKDFKEVEQAIEAWSRAPPVCLPAEVEEIADSPAPSPPPATINDTTPLEWRGNPEPAVVYDAPKLPLNGRLRLPPGVTGEDQGTPTPTPKSDTSLSSEARVLLPAIK